MYCTLTYWIQKCVPRELKEIPDVSPSLWLTLCSGAQLPVGEELLSYSLRVWGSLSVCLQPQGSMPSGVKYPLGMTDDILSQALCFPLSATDMMLTCVLLVSPHPCTGFQGTVQQWRSQPFCAVYDYVSWFILDSSLMYMIGIFIHSFYTQTWWRLF